MKNILLGIITFFFLLPLAFSQTYVPFPTDTATWRERLVVRTGPYSYYDWEYQYLLTPKDTVVGSHVYKIVIYRQAGNSGLPNPPIVPLVAIMPDSICGIREDNKRIYLSTQLSDSNAERLIYDFNLNIGDTIKFNAAGYGIVNAIDSVLIGSSYRKRFLLTKSYWAPEYIIEGIGSPYGLVPWGPHNPSPSDLICFSYKNQVLYTDSNNTCAYIYADTTPTNVTTITSSINIKISPNPFSNNIDIQTKEPISFTLYNILGVPLVSNPIDNNYLVDCSSLCPGIYMLMIKNKQGQIIKEEKMIKQ